MEHASLLTTCLPPKVAAPWITVAHGGPVHLLTDTISAYLACSHAGHHTRGAARAGSVSAQP